MGEDVGNPNLTRCSDCNGTVSINARACPHCGCAFEAPRRKLGFRLSGWQIFGLLLLAFYALGSLSSKDTETAVVPISEGSVAAPLLPDGPVIPRSDPGDKGSYYLIESRRMGEVGLDTPQEGWAIRSGLYPHRNQLPQ